MKNKKVIWPETLKNHTKLINLIFHSQVMVIPRRLDLVLLQLVFFKGDLAKAIDRLGFKSSQEMVTQPQQRGLELLKKFSRLVDNLFEECSRIPSEMVSVDAELCRLIRLNTVQSICLWLEVLPYQTSMALRRKWLKKLSGCKLPMTIDSQ